MSKPEIYLLAGLGFDKRIFYNLSLRNVNINYLEWLEPESMESINHYVDRISDQIKSSEKPVILVGHSFGGIIVQKLSKIVDCSKVIIISSIKSKNEIPISLKFLKRVPLHKYINKKIILRSFPVWARIFGYNSVKGRMLFHQMISNSSDNYFRWSLDKIVNVEFDSSIPNLIHIHGTRDKTFPLKKITNPIIIQDGSHFMVFSKAEEVSEVLNREIELAEK
jgi:pimeloyl-ACP methyl ester carboxylesterase